MPHAKESQKSRILGLISELSERLVKSLDYGDEHEPSEGKEVASFSDIKECLTTILAVYRTLNGAGDLGDEQGTALGAYRKELINGRTGQNRR